MAQSLESSAFFFCTAFFLPSLFFMRFSFPPQKLFSHAAIVGKYRSIPFRLAKKWKARGLGK